MKFFEKYGMSKTIQFFVGCLILLLMVILGAALFPAESKVALMFRMFIGLTIGYTLSRAAMGFAGTVNRAYNSGSTKLMKAIALLFMLGGVATFIALMGGVLKNEDLWTNSINHGLIIGATLFGFGMSFTICCASGVLTDLAESPLRALIVIFFFGAGLFLGTALVKQDWMAWYKQGIFGLEAFKNGVSFTSWFSWDGTNGALGALILTIILAVAVMVGAHFYEKKRIANGTYFMCESERAYEEAKNASSEDESLAYRIIAKPWSMTLGAAVLAVAFGATLLTSSGGWGVSGPLGNWFARFITIFGVSPEAIQSFTKGGFSAGSLTSPFFTNQMNIQDLSIFAGALIYMLMAGKFLNPKAWLFKPLEIVFFAFGGLFVGIAIKFAGGCNAGGLTTPIAEFSLSGWIYLVCIIVGGTLGNMVRKYLYKVTKLSD